MWVIECGLSRIHRTPCLRKSGLTRHSAFLSSFKSVIPPAPDPGAQVGGTAVRFPWRRGDAGGGGETAHKKGGGRYMVTRGGYPAGVGRARRA